MINKGNLSSYKDNNTISVYDPVNGWGNDGMQIPTNTPPKDPQKLFFSEGQINFKQVSVPPGFVYHKISIPSESNSNSYKIKHTSVKINDNDSFIYANTPSEYDNIGGQIIEYQGRSISDVGITYVMYPHIVLRIEHYQPYYIYDYYGDGSVITNGGIKFEVDNINSYKAVLVEIFIELDIRYLLNDSLNPFVNNQNWSSVSDIWNWFKNVINNYANTKQTIRLNLQLKDILNKNYINFIGANITKYNCNKENNTITYLKQENGETYFTSKNDFLNELNKSGTPGDGNVFYNNNGNVVNIYNDFHSDSDTVYNIRGIFNYRDIENNINDTYTYTGNETIENYIYYLDNNEKDNIIFLESVALSLMRYYELNNINNYVNYDVNDLSTNSNNTLITKLKELTTAEDDILWGKGIPQLANSIVSAYTFKKNKILLKVRK